MKRPYGQETGPVVRPGIISLLLTLFLLSSAWARPWVVAHRGGMGLGPENALATFKKAISLGVDAIELDIHQSRDGHLVVIHDLTLDRTYGRPGRVDKMTRSQLLEVGVPTLQDVIDAVDGQCRLVVEIKQPKDGTYHQGIEARLIEVLERNDLRESTLVISFYKKSLRKMHELDPTITTGYLYAYPVISLRELKADLGIGYIGPHYMLANEDQIRRAHALGLKVGPWTVNGPAGMQYLIDKDIDAITTNYPDRLLEVLEHPPE